jgi:hypothetical protein
MNFVDAALAFIFTGDDKPLRSIPEGRQFLLEMRREERKVPLEIRRIPRLLGEAMAKTIDDEIIKIIRGTQ